MTAPDRVPLEAGVLERQGCPLHYWLAGPAGGPLVVLAHGAGIDHQSWRAQWPVVAAEYRVLLWDVRGHGASQPAGQAFSVPLAADDLLALLDLLGVEKAVLVGHSNGSYIAQEVAYRHPARVQALVVADGTCITWPRSAWQRWLLRASPALMALLPYATLTRAFLPYLSVRPEVQDYAYAAFQRLTKAQFIAVWNGVVTGLREDPHYQIAQPLLLVHGDDDRTGDIMAIAPRWAAATPNCQYEVIPNARHLAMLDNPEHFNQLLMAFLAKWSR